MTQWICFWIFLCREIQGYSENIRLCQTWGLLLSIFISSKSSKSKMNTIIFICVKWKGGETFRAAETYMYVTIKTPKTLYSLPLEDREETLLCNTWLAQLRWVSYTVLVSEWYSSCSWWIFLYSFLILPKTLFVLWSAALTVHALPDSSFCETMSSVISFYRVRKCICCMRNREIAWDSC